ncbi:SGNH/GDSL hydrolase family protein [Kitasatospora sp. NBC_01250]|uniref:SGNH/GDSL hydrolase family protein n=1 Tax=unclassified Kitasatospora TaxID=2633591 RepID=UPI002E139D82|nr:MULTISPECIES: SGNH/GDSL hydrolase family protein [unclassified Kitasatospora]WSJ69718.1 SGNH/GDSL hydrolase family protein [Kitasatospora sp. NBC_01302]
MTAPTRSGAAGAAARPQAVRFAALGDSLTEGVGSPCADGWRGWTALLAPALASDPALVAHHNLAASGALAADLTLTQLPAALALEPQFAAVVIGGNDTLRAGFDIARTAAALDTTLRALVDRGAVPLTACLPDPGLLLGLPAALARPLERRMAAVNAVVHELSHRYRAVHLHLAGLPWLRERALLSADRLHPSPAGHLLIARQFHLLLAESGHRVGPPPSAVQAPPPPGRAADLWWLATRGTAWLARRSVDLLPGLLALAAVESAHRLRGTAPALDARSRAATAAALADLPVPP